MADQQRSLSDPNIRPLPATGATRIQKPSAMHDATRDPETLRDADTVVSRFPIVVQMPPLSEHFYSREKLLGTVGQSLRSPGSICVVHGVGGVGKTLLAAQYSHKHEKYYDAIFWLQADTLPGLADSYLQMVTALGIANNLEDHHQVIAKGRNWLQETGPYSTKVICTSCLLYTSPSPRDGLLSRMPSSA